MGRGWAAARGSERLLTSKSEFHYPACGSALSARATNQSLFRYVASTDGHLRRDAVSTHEKEGDTAPARAAEGANGGGALRNPRGAAEDRPGRGPRQVPRRPR